jgi:hypothetical protein
MLIHGESPSVYDAVRIFNVGKDKHKEFQSVKQAKE